MLELYLTALLYLAAASALTVIIVKKPEMFWECVIFIALLSLSVKICGYAVLDELLAGTMLLGALTVISRDSIKPAPFASTAAK